MLFTGKGDNGTTKVFDTASDIRISKGSLLSEALGTLDELNSFLGLCKVESEKHNLKIGQNSFVGIIHEVQQNLFTVQAELAGAKKSLKEEKLRTAEDAINRIEKQLHPINTFFISGGTELGARFDVARTLARRAERVLVRVSETKERELGEWSLAYMNRLSSLLYALARLTNNKFGIVEEPPSYE